MNTLIQMGNAAGAGFEAFVLGMLIQSSVVILLILTIDLLIRKRVRAVFRYGLWMLVLIKLMLPVSLASPTGLGYWLGIPMPRIAQPSEMATPPIAEPVPLLIENPQEAISPGLIQMTQMPPIREMMYPETPMANPAMPPDQPEVTATPEPAAAPAEPAPEIHWQAIVLLGWLFIVLVLSLLLAQRVCFVRHLVAQAQDAKGTLRYTVNQCREKLGIKIPVPVKLSASTAGPSVCGLWRPVILFPYALVNRLSRQEMESVLLHELTHIKRRDLWVNLVQTILQILYFFHPLLWLANTMIRRIREQAVDEAVLVAMQRRAEEYSNTLVRVFRLSLQRPAFSLRLIGVVESKTSLTQRIKHMLSRPLPKSAKLGILGVLTLLVLGAVLLPMAEAQRRQDESPASVSTETGESQEDLQLEFDPNDPRRAAQVELALDKEEFYLGENVLLHFGVTNRGDRPFSVGFGHDYRGSPRPLRFKVVAFDENGKPVDDPYPAVTNMGGLGGEKSLPPGETFWNSLALMRYCDFAGPGSYTVRVYHDLGWDKTSDVALDYETLMTNALPQRPHLAPIVEARITLVEPDARQARQVIDDILALPVDANATWGKKTEPFQDVTTLRCPVYLPILREMADRGNSTAVAAIGSIPTPQATQALMQLANQDQETAAEALTLLLQRLPDPQHEGFGLGKTLQRLVRLSWRDEFAPAVRQMGWKLLESTDRDSRIQGARIFRDIGRPDDFARFVKCLDLALEAMRHDPVEQNAYPRPTNLCDAMVDAGWQLIERGAPIPNDPQTPGESALFMRAIGARDAFRPADRQTVAARLLRHPIPYIRAITLKNLVKLPTEISPEHVVPLLKDEVLFVSVQACNVAQASESPPYRDAALDVLRTAEDEWLLRAAHRAALSCGAGRDRVLETCIEQLAKTRPADSRMYFSIFDLMIQVVQREGGTGYSQTQWDDAAELATRWRQFLEIHRERIRAGRSFTIAEPPLRRDLFPRGFQFSRTRGAAWPDWSKKTPTESIAETSAAWGKPVEGVQCRLQPKRTAWYVREAPEFLVFPRVEEEGADLLLSNGLLYGCQVEVDGTWFDYWSTQAFMGQAYLSCRELQKRGYSLDLTLTPGHFRSVEEKRALVLSAGKHTVRFAWAAYGSDYKTNPPDKRPPLHVVSNPVEIEIRPAEAEQLQKQGEQYFREAQTSAQGSPKNPEYTIECIRKAMQYPQSDVNVAQLYIYWGDMIQIQTPDFRPEVWGPQRKKAAEIYLEGLHEVLKHNLPANLPELPVVERYTVDGPPEITEKYRKINELQVQARQEAKRIRELIQHRQTLTGQLVQMYAREPDAFGELRELTTQYLYSRQAAQQIVTAAGNYRTDPKTPIPAMVLPVLYSDDNQTVMESSRDYQFWGPSVDGVQCRVRAEKSTWPQGSLPKLFADLRNRGQQDLRIAIESESWELEIDGHWHKPNTSWSGGRRRLPLAPGQRQENLEVWIPAVDNLAHQLQALKPGRHTLRVARLFNDPWRPGDEVLRVVSHPIAIEIVSVGNEKDPWGKMVDGIQVSLRPEKQICTPGDTLKLMVEIRNWGSTVFQTNAFASVGLEVDGEAYTPKAWERSADKQVRPFRPKTGWTVTTSLADYGLDTKIMTPGTHVIRAMYLKEQKPVSENYPDTLALSLPVEIEIVTDGNMAPRQAAGCRIRAQVLDYEGKSVVGAMVELQTFAGGDTDDMNNYGIQYMTTAADGRCVFENVAARSVHIGRAFTGQDGTLSGTPYGLNFNLELEPGRDYQVTLGGKGRPVIGKLVPASGNESDIDWSRARADFNLRAAPFSMGFWEDNAKILKAMVQAEGKNFYDKGSVKINPDGTFRIDNVRAGHYMFRVKVSEEPEREGFNLFREVRIPLMRDGASDAPFNLGTLAVGYGNDPAPLFVENSYLGSLVFDKQLPVLLVAGNDEQPDVVSTENIRFHRDGDAITAVLNLALKSTVEEKWRASLALVGENGSSVARDDVILETSRIINEIPSREKMTLNFSLGRHPDLTMIPRFHLRIQPLPEELYDVTRIDAPLPLITGTVIGIDGRPAAGYRVTALPRKWSAQHGLMPTTLTDKQGGFSFTNLPDGPCDVSVTSDPRTNQPNMRIVDVPVKNGETIRVQLSLESTYRYGGRVVDAAGTPQPDRNVLAIWKDPAGKAEYSSNTKTDSDGRYRFALPFRQARRILLNDTGKPEPEHANVEGNRDDLDIQLTRDKNGGPSDRIAWGEVVDGLQLGLQLGLQDRPYRQGEKASFEIYVRNAKTETVKLMHYGLRGWNPIVRDAKGKNVFVWAPVMNIARPAEILTLKPDAILSVGSVDLQLQINPDAEWDGKDFSPRCFLEPGNYRVSQNYLFGDHPDADWHGQLSTGQLAFNVLPRKTDVQIQLNAAKGIWSQDDDPAFKVSLRNTGARELKTSLISSLVLEIDDKPYAPRAWWNLGIIPVMPLGPGKEYSFDLKLSQFVADGNGADALPPGRHRITAVLLNNHVEGGGLFTSLDGYQEMVLATSKPAAIEILVPTRKLSTSTANPRYDASKLSLACTPTKQVYQTGEELEFECLVTNRSAENVSLAWHQTAPDSFCLMTGLTIRPPEGMLFNGTLLAASEHATQNTVVGMLRIKALTLGPNGKALFKLNQGKANSAGTFQGRMCFDPMPARGGGMLITNDGNPIQGTWTDHYVYSPEMSYQVIDKDTRTLVPDVSSNIMADALKPKVQVRMQSLKTTWNQDDDPAFKVTIRNTGTRELKTSLLASLSLEIDGELYAPRMWGYRGLTAVMPFGPGKEYSMDVKLSQFVADGNGADALPPGRHVIKAVYLNNNSDDGLGLNTSVSRYQDMALGYSEPVEIHVILAESKWGDPVNGLRAAVEFSPEKESYTQGQSVAIRLHVQNVSDQDVKLKSVSDRQDWAIVKDVDGKDLKVQRRFHSGVVGTLSHTIKPGDVLVLKTTGLGFAELEDQTPDEFQSVKEYFVGSVLRCTPQTVAVHYNVNRDLKTGVRKVTIVEKPQIAASQITMKQAVETLARTYRARICFEDVIDDDTRENAAEPYRLHGKFKAQTIDQLLDQLTQSGPFTWVKYNDTYVVYPRENSLLESSVSIETSGSLESVARKTLDSFPAGNEIDVNFAGNDPASNANRKRDIQHLWVSTSPVRYILARAAEKSGKDDTEILWTFTKEQGRRRLTFYCLP